MAKIDCPKELLPFYKTFNKLVNKHSDYQIYSDLLEIIICCYAMNKMEEKYLKVVKKYSRDELTVFAELFAEVINLYSDNLHEGTWYDGLGMFYESVINTPAKASRTGQFFTPTYVCDMSARMMINGNSKDDKRLKINDCACGSGRMLLAANAVAPGNLFFAEDIDPLCANLTAVNFLFHLMEGQIVCHDTIDMMSWNFGYEIKRTRILEVPVPVIREIEKEEAFVWQMGVQMMAEHNERSNQKAVTDKLPAPKQLLQPIGKEPVKSNTTATSQLSIF